MVSEIENSVFRPIADHFFSKVQIVKVVKNRAQGRIQDLLSFLRGQESLQRESGQLWNARNVHQF